MNARLHCQTCPSATSCPPFILSVVSAVPELTIGRWAACPVLPEHSLLWAQTGSRQNSKHMLLMDPLKWWFIHTIIHKVTEEQYYSCPSKFHLTSSCSVATVHSSTFFFFKVNICASGCWKHIHQLLCIVSVISCSPDTKIISQLHSSRHCCSVGTSRMKPHNLLSV